MFPVAATGSWADGAAHRSFAGEAPQALWAVFVPVSRKHRVSVCSIRVWEVTDDPGSPLHHVNHSGSWEAFHFGCHLELLNIPVSIAQCFLQKRQVCHQPHSAIFPPFTQ